MPGPDRSHPENLVDAIKNVFDTASNGQGGLGPTLGQDLGEAAAPTDETQAADERYDPSTVEATRSRQQGLGVGAKDLASQRDPASGVVSPRRGVEPGAEDTEDQDGD